MRPIGLQDADDPASDIHYRNTALGRSGKSEDHLTAAPSGQCGHGGQCNWLAAGWRYRQAEVSAAYLLGIEDIPWPQAQVDSPSSVKVLQCGLILVRQFVEGGPGEAYFAVGMRPRDYHVPVVLRNGLRREAGGQATIAVAVEQV